MAAPKPPTAPKGPRGEIAELTASLQSLCTVGKRSDRELRMQKRDVFKKVINYLTVGMDMSSLFPSMTSCANLSPDDLVLKKMLYLYITHYAAQAPDLALLTINQLHKDCVDTDPLVRGLALRSLCSLRLSNFLEYVSAPVMQGLGDKHPYVRRTGVMGVLKIYHVDKAVVENTGMLDTVHQLLRTDSDPQVLANCVTVLTQILGPAPLLDKATLYALLNRVKDLSEWSQCAVLELVGAYKPAAEAEVYELLNALEDRLGVANSAIALAATKAFLHLTLDMPATHQQVLERIKEPLKSAIGRDDPGVTYAVLAHMLLLAQRAPVIFEQDYTTFYCRTHDPWYIKKLKMEILSTLASATNVYDIVNELTEYARDVVHPNMAKEAVRAVGRIALAVPDVAGIVERLLIFLESGCDAVVSEALVVTKDLLRRFPDLAEVVVAQVMAAVAGSGASPLSSLALGEPQARAALLWIIGQFGQFIPDAPYWLEPLVEGWAAEDDIVKLAALTAAAQLFFKRPPESRNLLGGLLAAALNDTNQDVHDRALLYYRLLRLNVAEAERVINPPLAAVTVFSEGLTTDMKDAIFAEFNTLSVVYQMPSANFLEHVPVTYQPLDAPGAAEGGLRDSGGGGGAAVDNATNLLADVDDVVGAGPGGAASELDLLGDLGDGGAASSGTATPFNGLDLPMPPPPVAVAAADPFSSPPLAISPLKASHVAGNGGVSSLMDGLDGLGTFSSPPPPPGPTVRTAAAKPAAAADLLDLDGWLGLGGGGSTAAPPPGLGGSAAGPTLELDPQAKLAPQVFQDKWKALPAATTTTEQLNDATIAAMAANGHRDVSAHFTQAYIQTTASGGAPPTYKYYFYGQARGSGVALVEMVVSTTDRRASLTFKSELARPLTEQFVDLFKNCLAGFVR